jgi:hypothetical protein
VKLSLSPPCITHATIIQGERKALPDLKLHFYSRIAKAEGLILQSIADDGRVLDTVVLAVSPKDGKISASRRYQPVSLEIDKAV